MRYRRVMYAALCAAWVLTGGGVHGDADWMYSLGTRQVAVPAYWSEGAERVVFALGRDPRKKDGATLLAALNAGDGQEYWRREFDEPTTTDTTAHWRPVVYPTRDGYTVFVVASETLYAIDKHGDVEWTFTLPDKQPMRMTTPKIGPDDKLFLTATVSNGWANTSLVLALDPDDGTLLWNSTISGFVNYPPVFIRKSLNPPLGLIVVARDKGGAVALDSNDGKMVWNAPQIKGTHRAQPTVGYTAGGFLVFVVTTEHGGGADATYVTSLNISGDTVWKALVRTEHTTNQVYYSAFVPGNDGVYGYMTQFVATQPSVILATNLTDGGPSWHVSDNHNLAMLSDPVLDEKGGMLYTAAVDGAELSYVYCVDLYHSHDIRTKQVVTARPEDPRYISTPPAPLFVLDCEEGFASVPGIDGNLYAITLPTAHDVTSAPAPPKKSTFSMGLLIGVLGGAAGLVLFILPFFLKSSSSGSSTDFDLEPLKRAARRGKSSAPINPQGSGDVLYNSNAKYVALRLLGSGAFGTVYKVKCQTDGRLYAMKRIPCDSEAQRQTAVKEWKLLHQVHHPNLITAHETFVNWSEENRPEKEGHHGVRRYVCIVLDYMEEGDLHQYVSRFRRGAKVDERVVLSFGAQICSLLAVLHGLSPPIIHRDMKPENVLLADGYTRAVVTDFGLARFVNTAAYLSSQVGTLAYIAPETWDRHYGPGVDVWALGCIMFVLATRRIRSDNTRILWREANHPQFHRSIADELAHQGYSDTLIRITIKLLTPDRRQRPTATQCRAWFDDVVEQGGTGTDICLTPGDEALTPSQRTSQGTTENELNSNHLHSPTQHSPSSQRRVFMTASNSTTETQAHTDEQTALLAGASGVSGSSDRDAPRPVISEDFYYETVGDHGPEA